MAVNLVIGQEYILPNGKGAFYTGRQLNAADEAYVVFERDTKNPNIVKKAFIPEKDLVWKMCRGSGNGGQKRNKTSSVVQLTHLPTKIMIRCEQGRSQSVNKEIALQNLKDKLIAIDKGNFDKTLKRDRREQIGDGQRGDKIRTISFLYDNVTDHRTGKRISIDRFSKGFLEELNYESHEERKNQESC